MTPGARAAAAIDILTDIMRHHRPAKLALADWGRRHRFAGSGDRAAIGDIVLDCLRRRASLAWRMEDDSPRALVLAYLAFMAGHDIAAIEQMGRERHGFGKLSKEERKRLENPRPLDEAPPWVRGDYPQWAHEHFRRVFGEEAVRAGEALAERAPLDIRVNTLLATREEVAAELARHKPEETPYSPWGLRFHENARGRLPNLTAELAFHRGHFEIQDEGSQIAALLTGARPGELALDYCAGGGGKTLALAAMMGSTGRIMAHDAEMARLSPIIGRMRRAEVRNVEVVAPHEREEKLASLKEACDLVLVDAPCSGTGTWRRRPDAKWRLKPRMVTKHVQTQATLLDEAAAFVKHGGRLVYVTCSILPPENAEQATAFLDRHGEFEAVDWREMAASLSALPASVPDGPFLQLAPHLSGTDGFFVAIMQRKS